MQAEVRPVYRTEGTIYLWLLPLTYHFRPKHLPPQSCGVSKMNGVFVFVILFGYFSPMTEIVWSKHFTTGLGCLSLHILYVIQVLQFSNLKIELKIV